MPIPSEWMPKVCHRTAGGHKVSQFDRGRHHLPIEGDGKLCGKHSISDNVSTTDCNYAAHTQGCNTGSIGIALCCMAAAIYGTLTTTDDLVNRLTATDEP